jgi:putative two-component system response regulator
VNAQDSGGRATLLVVDDTPQNLRLMSSLLGGEYRVLVANGGERALELAAGDARPDLILLDVMMPQVDGYEVCRLLKENPLTRDIPVIFLTARNEAEDEQIGFDVGAVDYITKPISPPIMLSRVHAQLMLKRARDLLADQNQYLEAEVRRRMRELAAVQDATIMALASLAETRDNETGNHIRRTQHYVRALALAVRGHPRFRDALRDDAAIELLYKSAPLHDIGKVGIPDHILLKPGELTPAEFAVMRTHTLLGRDAIMVAEHAIETPQSFLRYAREIALSHHEKWNGSGYPEQLAGDAIPLSARLMAVADVYDALISRRVYKPPFPHEMALAIMREGRGSHFDPDLLDAFLGMADECQRIARRFADTATTAGAEAPPGVVDGPAVP